MEIKITVPTSVYDQVIKKGVFSLCLFAILKPTFLIFNLNINYNLIMYIFIISFVTDFYIFLITAKFHKRNTEKCKNNSLKVFEA
jgi:hypothetical protein